MSILYTASSRGPTSTYVLRYQTEGIEKGLFLGGACCLSQGILVCSTRSGDLSRMAAVAHVTGTGSASSHELLHLGDIGRLG